MNDGEQIEVEKKKDNDSLFLLYYPVNPQCLPRKIPIEKKEEEERKKN